MASNFELPWDIKPVDKARLSDTIAYLETNDGFNIDPFLSWVFQFLRRLNALITVRFSQYRLLEIRLSDKGFLRFD